MYYDRLLTLAKFLNTLQPKQFNFQNWVTEFDYGNSCGTVCCAVGWMPKIFPLDVKWGVVNQHTITLRNHQHLNNPTSLKTATEFFGLEVPAALHLFTHLHDNQLGDDTTAPQVAQHIRNFVEEQCIEEFKSACRKMPLEIRNKWVKVLAKSKRCELRYVIPSQNARCVVGAFARANHKTKEWLFNDGKASWDCMPDFRWYEIYDPATPKECRERECAAVVLNDDFHYSFAKFRKLIASV